jgi:ankyrin repeat protein
MTEKYESFEKIINILKNESNLLETILKQLDENNKSLLEIAIEKEHLKIIELILQQTFIINPLLITHTSAKYGSSELFDLIVQYNIIQLEADQLNNNNLIHLACYNNRFEFIKSYINYEKTLLQTNKLKKSIILNKNNKNQTPLQIAIMKRHEKCVIELLNSDKIDLNIKEIENNYSIYHLCIKYSDNKSLQILLGKKEKKYQEPLFIKSKKNETPLHLACQSGNLEALKILMNKLNNDLIQSVDLFLKEKNKNGSTCFHLACMNGHFNIVDYFLNELKINKSLLLEIADNYLNTPLLVSALNGHERIVELLLDNDANLNAKNKEKSTALEISCFKGYFEMSKLIMSRINSTIDDNLSSQNNLIHLASDSGASEVVRLLLSKGIYYELLRYLNEK